MGLSHLKAERPCKDYGTKCVKCRLRTWCYIYRRKPQEEEQRCRNCGGRESCPACETGVLYPCPHYEEEKLR